MEKIEFKNNSEPYLSAENLNQIQNNVEQAIEVLKEDIFQNNIKILWANSSPTSNFDSQKIMLNSVDYDFYEVISYGSDSKANCLSTGKIPKGEKAYLNQTYYSGGVKIRQRDIIEITDDSIAFGNCFNNGETTNANLIPIYVIGYKTGLFG